MEDHSGKGDADHLFLYDLFNKMLHRGHVTIPSFSIEHLIVQKYGQDLNLQLNQEYKSSVAYQNDDGILELFDDFCDLLEPWVGVSSEIEFDPNHPENERHFFDNIISRFGRKIANCVYPQARIDTILDPALGKSFLDQRVDFLFSFPHGKSFIVEPGDHDTLEQQSLDSSRDNAFRKASIDTLRIENSEIDNVTVLDNISEMIERLGAEKYLEEIAENKEALSLKYLFLLPTLIARGESILADIFLRHGWLGREQVVINVLERDLHVSEFLFFSFLDHLKRFTFLYGLDVQIPNIRVNVCRNIEYGLNEDPRLNTVLKEEGVEVNNISEQDMSECDLTLDLAILSIHHAKNTSKSSTNTITVRNSFAHNRNTELRYLSMPRPLPEREAHSNKYVLETFLQELFRKYSFRSGQLPIVQRVLSQKPTIGLLPTSAGKSICFQLSAMLTPGTTIVVDPIVALMQDQVQGLQEQYLISNVFAWHAAARVKDDDVGKILLSNTMLFMSPERLLRPGFRSAMRSLSASDIYINYAVIDEAHCVSMWGHDFRPSYLSLDRNFKRLCTFHGHEPVTVALTGTASQLVLIDLKRELNINDMDSIIRPKTFDRPELTFNLVECRNDEKEDVLSTVLGTISNRLGLSDIREDGYGIIFSYTPNEMWKLFGQYSGQDSAHVLSVISDHRFDSVKYGAYSGSPPKSSGISTEDWTKYKNLTLQAFKQGHINMLFGNTAIGVGIDNEKLNYVVNYRMPQSIEAYYQQSGRAGRNKQPSECYLIYSDDHKEDTQKWVNGDLEKMPKRWDDLGTVSFFHQNNFPGKDVDRTGALQVASGIFRNSVENGNVLLKYIDDRTERYISFWQMLGVIEDYQVSGIGRNTTYHLKRDPKIEDFLNDNDMTKLEVHLINSLQAYLSRYRPVSVRALKEQIEKRKEKSLSHKVLGHLIDFIYDQIGYQRREGIRTMVEFCNQEDSSAEALRRTIKAYFDYSEKFSSEIGDMADVTPEITKVLAILKRVEGFNDVEHLYWETRRLLDERYRIDWALINLYSMFYRERGISEAGMRLFERILESFDTDEYKTLDKNDFFTQYFSFISNLDSLYGENISLGILEMICENLFSSNGIDSLSFIRDLAIPTKTKNHLRLLITNNQLRSLLDVTRYSRVVG
ncbi:MAG: ATP-dependent DNA helicase RecQ [Candidatus Marinimicrobia bacterium]|nr:ATP-dependent DNA helicase RecQ [Candidatus Neomarinimicrobiota bacterium]